MIMKTLDSNSNKTAIVAGAVNLLALLNEQFQWVAEPEWMLQAANIILGGLWAVFIRKGIAKSGPQEQTNVAQKGP